MNPQDATLFASIIVATASASTAIATILLKLFSDRKSEDRASHRTLLQPLIADLGESAYNIIATCHTLRTAETTEKIKNWHSKAETEREKLVNLRPKLRYPLWGVDEGIRVLIRMPNWIRHSLNDPLRSKKILDRATELRHTLDIIAMRCFRDGRTPCLIERLQVYFWARQVRSAFESKQTLENPAE